MQRRLAAGSLALPASSPEKPSPACLVELLPGAPWELFTGFQLLPLPHRGKWGNQKELGFYSSELGWVGAALPLATVGSTGPGERLVAGGG